MYIMPLKDRYVKRVTNESAPARLGRIRIGWLLAFASVVVVGIITAILGVITAILRIGGACNLNLF